MRDRVVEQYEDVLQNIEAAILSVHRRNPALLDYDVEGALEALVGAYTTELRGRTPPERQLSDLRGDVYRAVRPICEWRLGREAEGMPAVADGAKTVEEIVACLKRIQKSVRRWTREGGRQGYLRFVGQYL